MRPVLEDHRSVGIMMRFENGRARIGPAPRKKILARFSSAWVFAPQVMPAQPPDAQLLRARRNLRCAPDSSNTPVFGWLVGDYFKFHNQNLGLHELTRFRAVL
jgi:hypothetical protein